MKYIELENGAVRAGPFDYTGSLPVFTGHPITAIDVTNETPLPTDGWTYTNGVFAERLVAVDELRATRNQLLSQSDWRDLPSYQGSDQAAWRTYRQELRDLPNNYVATANPEFPKI
jgi:hypothetical protein